MSEFWPTELRISRDRHRLSVTFDDGVAFDLSRNSCGSSRPRQRCKGTGRASG